MTCEWCGHDHAVTQLCSRRPKWSRRGFLGLLGAAAVGAMLPTAPLAMRADAFATVSAPLSASLAVGDVFTIAGVYAANPKGQLRRFIVTNTTNATISLDAFTEQELSFEPIITATSRGRARVRLL